MRSAGPFIERGIESVPVMLPAAEPKLARVTLWTDYGIPTRTFDVYLTGHDSQDIDLRPQYAAAARR